MLSHVLDKSFKFLNILSILLLNEHF